MRVFLRLVKIYLASAFNLENIKAQIQKRKKKGGETVTRTSALKIIFLIILFILLFVQFLFLFGIYSYGLYMTAKAIHNMKFLFEVSAVLISLFTLLFGFVLTASTYYIGEIEQQFLSMPIRPKILFGAKFAANCVNSLIISVSFFAVLMFVYGFNEQPPVLFYIWGFICSLVIPLPAIGFCYFFNILLMRFTKFFKNKNVITVISSIIGLTLSLGLQYVFQSASNGDFQTIAEKMASGAPLFEEYGNFYPPVKLVGTVLSTPVSFKAVLYLVLLLAVCAVIPYLVIHFMSRMYGKSLIGFSEKKVKKLETKEVSEFIRKKVKTMPPLAAYVKREFDMMNRTPLYFLNGPFIIIFLPITVAVILLAKGVNLESLHPAVLEFMRGNAGFVAAGLIAGFLGSMTNIADTALSRDAKSIPFIKSIPVNIELYMYAKLIHAMIFAVFAIIIGVGIPAFIFKLGFISILLAFLTGLAFSALINLLSLFLDTAHPKLRWDNPASPMKQNANIVFIMLFNCIVVGLSALILFFSRNAYTWVLAVYFIVVPAALFSILIKPYGIYAEKKISRIEL